MQDLSRHGPSTIDAPTGASQLVLSGELTEGVSDLSEAMTAPGGVPAMREINQNRSHPDAPFVEEQNLPGDGNYRRLVRGDGDGNTRASWDNVSGGPRTPPRSFPPRPHAGQNVGPHRPPNPAADSDELTMPPADPMRDPVKPHPDAGRVYDLAARQGRTPRG